MSALRRVELSPVARTCGACPQPIRRGDLAVVSIRRALHLSCHFERRAEATRDAIRDAVSKPGERPKMSLAHRAERCAWCGAQVEPGEEVTEVLPGVRAHSGCAVDATLEVIAP